MLTTAPWALLMIEMWSLTLFSGIPFDAPLATAHATFPASLSAALFSCKFVIKRTIDRSSSPYRRTKFMIWPSRSNSAFCATIVTIILRAFFVMREFTSTLVPIATKSAVRSDTSPKSQDFQKLKAVSNVYKKY